LARKKDREQLGEWMQESGVYLEEKLAKA